MNKRNVSEHIKTWDIHAKVFVGDMDGRLEFNTRKGKISILIAPDGVRSSVMFNEDSSGLHIGNAVIVLSASKPTRVYMDYARIEKPHKFDDIGREVKVEDVLDVIEAILPDITSMETPQPTESVD